MAQRIRLYEDIDGCLNASYNARAWRNKEDPEDLGGYQRAWVHPEYDDFGNHRGPGSVKFRMEWNERLIAALNELPLELVWSTTWRADSLKVGEAMGLTLRPHRILHPLSGETTFPSIEWKWAAIVQEQELNPSPFIAVDDEWDYVSSYKRETLKRLGGLIISPDSSLGITPAHVEMMRAYIAQS